jgi:hypothetical protein
LSNSTPPIAIAPLKQLSTQTPRPRMRPAVQLTGFPDTHAAGAQTVPAVHVSCGASPRCAGESAVSGMHIPAGFPPLTQHAAPP